jgi:hypothetical protein
MGEVSTIGLDIAKSVFQIHGVDVDGVVVIRKRITRAKLLEFFASLPACLVGIDPNDRPENCYCLSLPTGSGPCLPCYGRQLRLAEASRRRY